MTNAQAKPGSIYHDGNLQYAAPSTIVGPDRSESELRLSLLGLAINSGCPASDAISFAERMLSFVKSG